MANPNSYDEHREKLINARMEAKAESRIRARKDQPKVNKALAERLRRVEEGGGKKSKSKSKDVVEDGGEGGVLSDPRFKELFENPEYEVDEQSREFALLNPATVHNANLNAVRKTAVQDEEDDSAESSSGLGESDDEDEEDEDLAGDKEGSGSNDEVDDDGESGSGSDSDDGDLRQYDPRKLKPGEEKRQMLRHYQYNKPQLQVASSSNSGATSSSTSFGQRLHSSKPDKSTKSDPRMDNVLAMRRSGDGGMEMSFIPTGSSKPRTPGTSGSGLFNDDYDQEAAAARKKEKKVERFGHGLQKGLEEGDDGDLEGDSKSGRTKRRHPGRSASKNAFRKR